MFETGQRVVYFHTPTGQFCRGNISQLQATVVEDGRRMVTIKIDGDPKQRRVMRDSVEVAEVQYGEATKSRR